jgi:hypothetical protein
LPCPAARTVVLEVVERLLEAIGVRALGLGQRLEPVGDLAEAFFAALFAMPGYMSVYSCVSPAIAALRFSEVAPIGNPVAGSPTASRYSRCPWAWPVSPSAVERNTADTSLKPSTSALAAKYR